MFLCCAAVTNARIFPYVASIYYTPASGTGAAYLGCTGTIIHATTVLTAGERSGYLAVSC